MSDVTLEPIHPGAAAVHLPDPDTIRAELERVLVDGDLRGAVRLTKRTDAVAHAAELALGRSAEARTYAVEALRGRWVYAQIAGPNPGSKAGGGSRWLGNDALPNDGLDKMQRSRWRELNALDAEELDRLLAVSGNDDWPAFGPLIEAVRRKTRQTVDRDARTVTIAELDPVFGDGWILYPKTIDAVLPALRDGSVDMIVTDPPYPAESLHLWSKLADHAARLLVPQGILCALTGQIHLPDVMAQLAAHLVHGWVYVQPLPGASTRILARHVAQMWKPWLAYSNGPWPSGRIDWHCDILDGAPRSKTRYAWEQSSGPAADLITALCPENGFVLDPFTGTGTYGVAALGVGRQYIGVEPDAVRFGQAVDRLRQVAP